MIYLSSDLHFSHDKPFIYRTRGFNNFGEMNMGIVKRFNSVLTEDDDLYLLGDCCMGLNELSMPYLEQIKGRKHLIIGNHDTDARIAEYRERGIFETIDFGGRIKCHKLWFILSHYPMLVGNETHDSIWNLHGHTHQTTNFSAIPFCYHVGIDSHSLYPISIEDIYKEIKAR